MNYSLLTDVLKFWFQVKKMSNDIPFILDSLHTSANVEVQVFIYFVLWICCMFLSAKGIHMKYLGKYRIRKSDVKRFY